MDSTRTQIDKTQKSLAILAIMRRIEQKRKKRPRRRSVPESAHPPHVRAVETLAASV